MINTFLQNKNHLVKGVMISAALLSTSAMAAEDITTSEAFTENPHVIINIPLDTTAEPYITPVQDVTPVQMTAEQREQEWQTYYPQNILEIHVTALNNVRNSSYQYKFQLAVNRIGKNIVQYDVLKSRKPQQKTGKKYEQKVLKLMKEDVEKQHQAFLTKAIG